MDGGFGSLPHFLLREIKMKQMLYKAGGSQKIHGKNLSTKIVDSEEALEAALADGWSETTDVESQTAQNGPSSVKKALGLVATGFGLVIGENATDEEAADLIIAEIESHEEADNDTDDQKSNDADEEASEGESPAEPPTEREALEAKADSLGVKYRSDISDEKLIERIEEKENELD